MLYGESMNPDCNHCREGRLPECAPLANPYVPFQETGSPQYEAKKGLVRGTLFPGLDLPFMGMVNKEELPDTPLHQLQALCFAIQELVLYLDTHSQDEDALELLRAYQEMYLKGVKDYEENYGPLSHTYPQQGKKYNWLKDPWPWDYCQKQE